MGRQRSGKKSGASAAGWVRCYRSRIAAGAEHCRSCGGVHTEHNPLTLAHLVPVASGGRFRLDNVTILCDACNRRQGTEVWPWLVSLLAEELAAPVGRRWALNRGELYYTGDGSLTTYGPLTSNIGDFLVEWSNVGKDD